MTIIQFPSKKHLELHEVCEQGAEYVHDQWAKAEGTNKLNDFFVRDIGYRADSAVNYLQDLSAIKKIEQQCGMIIVVFESTDPDAPGWTASFMMASGALSTPLMASEEHARCLNILVYLKLKRDLVANGYPNEL